MVKASFRGYVALGLGLLFGGGVGCNSVLGIDAATLVEAGGGGGGGGSGCADYCATVQKNCPPTGNFGEYLDPPTCMSICQNFEPGAPGDTTQDSLSCRNHYANLAATDPATNCRNAGPLGGSCGSNPCVAFCSLTQAFCLTAPLPPNPPYTSGSDCNNSCPGFVYELDAGDIALAGGDTLNCRIYHLESAYDPGSSTNRSTHCQHLAVVSATCFAPASAGGADAGAPAGDASGD
jgi:hypothetical protein